jgi:hypothetical protein
MKRWFSVCIQHRASSIQFALVLGILFLPAERGPLVGSAQGACPVGDLNGDCEVDLQDLRLFATHWLDAPGSLADLDGEQGVDMADLAVLARDWHQTGTPRVVINEIHYDPDVKTELVEFIELYNAGTSEVDLTGWYFREGVTYKFPPGSKLPANGYIIVAANPQQVRAKWSSGRFIVVPSLVLGPFAGKLDNDGEKIELCNAEAEEVDQVDYQLGFPWPTVGDSVPKADPPNGTGCSIQLVNPFLDNDLGGSWRPAYPTPAAQNKDVYADNIPPQIRQVKHSPEQPRSGEIVTVTAKITDPDGVASVTLLYQLVNPGNYICITDPVYNSSWTNVAMHDDGLNGDQQAGDDIYTVQLPALLQTNRRLVRYRIAVADNTGRFLIVPYVDDPQPNFAYFVYDGVPGWKGAAKPGDSGALGQVVEYSAEVMNSLPVYHLISKKSDVEACVWKEQIPYNSMQATVFKWYGTLIYDGKVYDHIRYRLRGGVWRYAMGKNMWKFRMNRGHYFQARDDYGRQYDTEWDTINFSACIQQGDYQHRGEQGMFEAAAFRFFNLMGCPASKTHWLHFRVIDEAGETGATQYEGDFWGLYMTLEQMDGRFLEEHGLPDGNLYKMDSGAPDAGPGGGSSNNQGPTQPTDNSDLIAFKNSYRSRPAEPWWRQNVNLTPYYGFRCVVEGVHHGDMEGGKNWFFYHDPVTNCWTIMPWDLDLTWANNMYGSGADEFTRNSIFSNTNLKIEYQNRQREFMDLFYNQDQAYQVLDDLADVIDPPTGGPTFVGADRAMWDYNPIMTSGYVNASKAGAGRFYQRAATKDFRGMVQIMKDYIASSNRAFNTYTEDPQAPQTPVVTATCPNSFPANALTFETSPFSDPQGGGSFAAMKWRIAEVALGSQAAIPQDEGIVLISEGGEWKYFKGTKEPSPVRSEWRQIGFDDSDWLIGTTAMGYGETFIVTQLGDMRGGYTTVYLRKTFDVADLDTIKKLRLEAKYDDGVNVWINGVYVGGGNVPSAELPFDATVSNCPENHDFITLPTPDPKSCLVWGTNIIAVQVINSYLSNSSDCFVDVRLIGETAEPGEPPSTPPTYQKKPGKYEIDAIWESEEITDFNTTLTIPASAVRVGRTYRVRCRMKDNTGRWSHWSDPVQFEVGEPLSVGPLANLRITELMYNPAAPPAGDTTDNDEFEFIELKNIGDEVVDLSYVSFTEGVTFDFDGSKITSLAPGDFVLVVKNASAFTSYYGTQFSGKIAGEYDGKLANDGEKVSLVDFWNGVIAESEFGDRRGWPLSADGAGHSLVPLDRALLGQPEGSLNYGGNWRASTYIGGSPGQDDPEPITSVVLNEIMAHTDYSDPSHPDHDSNDWIELYNGTGASINLRDWYLSDDIDNLKKWAIPAVEMAGHSRISFDEVTGFHNPINTGFGLNKAGEQVILSFLPGAATDRVVDCVRFKGEENDVSLGRYPDGGEYWLHMTTSRNAPNKDPVLDIVISELMYHPVDPNDEYVELYNPTPGPVILENADGTWRLDGGVDYTFPVGTSIPAGGRIIVVGFDPHVDTARFSAFRAAYGTGPLMAGRDIVGPWSGNLSNGGERLALERPQPPDQPGDLVCWVIADEVIYADVSPWPEAADGQGKALRRVYADQYHWGNDPSNWQAALPTPGRN